jgi:hypothetical protein
VSKERDGRAERVLGYARWYRYPSSASDVRAIVEKAFLARRAKEALIKNTKDRKVNNSQCS